FERLLTALRFAMLEIVVARRHKQDTHLLRLASALAQQCFLTDYILPLTDIEQQHVAQLQLTTAERDHKQFMCPLDLLTLAAYVPLEQLHEERTSRRKWPAELSEVLEQQVYEPSAQQRLRDSIPQISAIVNPVSIAVKQQYEEHPYPRWRTPLSVY